jgi:hypothetical protein
MTTVSQLIEWLKTQDQNKNVLVVREYYAGFGLGYATEMADLRLPTEENPYDVNVDVFDDSIWLGER